MIAIVKLLIWSLVDFFKSRGKRWSWYLRQGFKVDLTMIRTIHHEDTQTVHG